MAEVRWPAVTGQAGRPSEAHRGHGQIHAGRAGSHEDRRTCGVRAGRAVASEGPRGTQSSRGEGEQRGRGPGADRQPAAPSVSADGAVLPQPPRCARAVRLQTDGTFLASSGTRTSLDVLTPTVLPTRAAAGNQGGNRFPPAMPLQRPLLRKRNTLTV